MIDSYGDGWNGNVISFVQGGVTVSTATLATGTSGSVTVALCDGLATDVVLGNLGSFTSEVSFDLLDPNGTPVISGGTIPFGSASGTVLNTFTTNCAPPVACDPSNACAFTFDMVDSYGDGWNGWAYNFVQNGIIVGSGTLASGSAGTAVSYTHLTLPTKA